jgi:bacteriocin biosynthesis cyclodehydratase domain-containing protein
MTTTMPGDAKDKSPDDSADATSPTETASIDSVRVKLREATSLVLRPPDHLQFGTIPEHSLVLPLPRDVSPPQVMLVFREARRPVTLAELEARLGYCGIDYIHARGILADLRRAHLLRPLPSDTTVHVTGLSGVAGMVLHGLMRHGIAADAVRPGSATFSQLSRNSLVLLAGQLFPAPDVVYRLMERRIPHLPCAVVDGRVVIGPLVLPGVTPCLSCIDAHYHAQDEDWRMVRAQTSTGSPSVSADVSELATAVISGMVRTLLSTEAPFPTEVPPESTSRRILDPATLTAESYSPPFAPDCSACASARNTGRIR